MNKKFSTLVGCLLLGTAFSVNAQDLPKWYDKTQADFAWPKEADFAVKGKVPGFILNKDNVKTAGDARYQFSNTLNSLVPGISVAFDTDSKNGVAEANVVAGTKLEEGAAGWEKITPVYGSFDGGLGIIPGMQNNGEVFLTLNTQGLSNPTSIEFDIYAAKVKEGKTPNRNIKWKITAKSYALNGAGDAADLNIAAVTASGQQLDATSSIEYTANNAGILAGSKYTIRLNENANGGKNSLANKVIVFQITNEKASEADNNEAQDKNEPVTVIKGLNFTYQRPEVLFSTTGKIEEYVTPAVFAEELNAGAGYEVSDKLYTRIEYFNPAENIDLTTDNLELDLLSVYKLSIAYPFTLDETKLPAGHLLTSETKDGVTTYWIKIDNSKLTAGGKSDGLFTLDKTYDGKDGNKKYITAAFDIKFAPKQVKDFDASKYINAEIVARDASLAEAQLDGTSVPSFIIKPSTMAFDEYNQTKEAGLEVKNLPKFTNDVDWIANLTNNSGKPLQPKCEAVGFYAYDKDGKLIDINKDGKSDANDFVKNDQFDETFLTNSGNLNTEKYKTITLAVKYERGNVSTDLEQSIDFQEVFGLNRALKFEGNIDANDYTGKDLVDKDVKKNLGAIYPNDLNVTGNNQYVWFTYGSNGSVAEAMQLPDGKVLNEGDLKGHYERYFYAPFEANAPESARTSRVDTIFIHASELIPTVDNKAIVKFAIDQEDNAASNDFRYKASDSYGIDVAYFKNPVTGAKIAANENFRGGAYTDTLYFEIDLNNVAMVKAVKEKGLEINMKYVADTEEWAGADYNGGETQIFKVITADAKGHNVLPVKGLTDRGVVTNIYAQNYKDWYKFQKWEDGPGSDEVYGEQFPNDFGTSYINTCISGDSASFVIAGINVIDTVKVSTLSNQNTSFVYTQDEASEAYGTFSVDKKNHLMTIVPNEYGEIYAKINVKFAPSANDKALDTLIYEPRHKANVLRKFIYEDLKFGIGKRSAHKDTKFYGMGDLIYLVKDTLFNTRDVMGKNIKVSENYTGNLGDDVEKVKKFESGLFYDAGYTYQADSLFSVIHGDAKKPVLFFTDENGAVINTAKKPMQMGEIVFGTTAEKTINIVGRELPFEDLVWPVDETNSSTIFFTNSNQDIYPVKDAKYRIKDLMTVLGGDVTIPVTIKAKPSATAPCDTLTSLTVNVPVLCSVDSTINVSFKTVLVGPELNAFKPGDIQGDRANLSWKPGFKQGEVEHEVVVGLVKYNKKSSSIFISEVYAHNGTLAVELFNGTASKLNKDIFDISSPNYYLVLEESGKVIETRPIVSQYDIVEPYGAIAEWFNYDFKSNTLYTVTLKQGNITMDVFQFSTPSTHMGRRDDLIAAGQEVTEKTDPYRAEKYDQAQWTNVNIWNMGLESGQIGFAETVAYNETSKHATAFVASWDVAKSSMSGLYDGTLIKGLHNNITYDVWVIPALTTGMDCVSRVIPTKGVIATSDSKLNGGNVIADITFDIPTANEDINSSVTAISVVGDNGKVIVRNAAGKSVSVYDVLGKSVVKTVISSNEVEFNAPKGVVVVAVEGEPAVKAIVK